MNLPMHFLIYPSECPPLILISCDITDREGKYAPMRLGHKPFIGGNCHWQPNGDHNHLTGINHVISCDVIDREGKCEPMNLGH